MEDLEQSVGLAEAVYDNEAEWPDELVFGRGDILQVLDREPAGGLAEGWWLCADKQGRRGIAPANRLKMIHSFTTNGGGGRGGNGGGVGGGQGQERVITPRRFGDVFLYGGGGNHRRLFGDSSDDDDFFRQSSPLLAAAAATAGPTATGPIESLFSTVYDVPSALRNLYLLHASDRPFIVPDKIGNSRSGSFYPDYTNAGTITGGSATGRRPVVRNVPIRIMERRGDAEDGQTSSKAAAAQLAEESSRQQQTSSQQNKWSNTTTPIVGGGLDLGLGNSRSRSPPPPPPQRRHFNLSGPLLLSSLAAQQPASRANTSSATNSGSDEERSTVKLASGGGGPPTVPPAQRSSAERGGGGGTDIQGNGLYASIGGIRPMASSGPSSSFYDSPKSLLLSGTPKVATGNAKDEADSSANKSIPLSAEVVSPNMTTYDIPRRMLLEATKGREFENGFASSSVSSSEPPSKPYDPERLSVSSMDSKGSDYQELLGAGSAGGAELRLSAGMALDTLIKLLATLQTAVDKLRGLTVNSNSWRNGVSGNSNGNGNGSGRNSEETRIADIRSACRQSIVALKDFYDFASGAFVNVHNLNHHHHHFHNHHKNGLADQQGQGERLAKHLAHLVRPLGDSLKLLIKLQQSSDASGWTTTTTSSGGNDSLDQFVAVAGRVPEDAREVATFVHGNIGAIFPSSAISAISASTSASANNSPGSNSGGGSPQSGSGAATTSGGIGGQVVARNGNGASGNGSLHGNGPLHGNVSTNGDGPLLGNGGVSSSGNGGSAAGNGHSQRTVRFADNVHTSTGEVTSINGSGREKETQNGNGNGSRIANGNLHHESDERESEEPEQDDNDDETLDNDYDYVGERASWNREHREQHPHNNKISSSAENRKEPDNQQLQDKQEGQEEGTNSAILLPEDRQILQFYSPQIQNHMVYLSNAIDDFLLSVEKNEPPKIFVGHSKFVILAAHKLVYIGDIVAQCLRGERLRQRVKLCANNLCDVLKSCVTHTKEAAMAYPNIPGVQKMVDSMVNVSRVAYELKLFIQEAANL